MRVAPRLLTNLCYLAMMSLSIGLNLLPVFLTTISASYGGPNGLSQEHLGRLGSIAFAGLVLGIFVTGPLADRLGPKPFAQLGNALVGLGLIGAAFTTEYRWLAAALFCVGLGSGILDMVLSPVVAVLNPERRSAAMNWLHSFYGVGAVVTILVGTVALRMGMGWRTTCLVLVPLPIGLFIAFASLAFPVLTADGNRTPARVLLRRRRFWLALCAIFFGGATELGMAQWLPAYAELSLGFKAWVGGTALLLFSLAMVIGRMAVGAAGSRWNPYAVMAWGCGLSVVLFVVASFAPVPGFALTASIAVGLTGSCLWPTMLAVTADHYPDGGASMFGLLAAFGNAGGIFMPWLVGWVADRSNLHWGLALSAVAPALMLPAVLALRKRVVAA
jgi:fucose permease